MTMSWKISLEKEECDLGHCSPFSLFSSFPMTAADDDDDESQESLLERV